MSQEQIQNPFNRTMNAQGRITIELPENHNVITPDSINEITKTLSRTIQNPTQPRKETIELNSPRTNG